MSPGPASPPVRMAGEPWRTAQQAWRRSREQTASGSVLWREHLLPRPESILSQTRRSALRPRPGRQSEDDPDTGLVENAESCEHIE
ncbi:hypothetical protein GCM10009797_41580 [Nocardioides hwasunensis]